MSKNISRIETSYQGFPVVSYVVVDQKDKPPTTSECMSPVAPVEQKIQEAIRELLDPADS